MNTIHIKAYAKINIALDVLRKRPDGYHDVKMIMQTIDLHDEVSIKCLPSMANMPSIKLSSNLPYLPNDRNNIVYRAAELFMKQMNINESIEIIVKKNIPVAAGLAGGSTDAAATLIALNKLFKTDLSTAELMNLGIQLGADVPFCIMQGTALAEGIGEKLSPLNQLPDFEILLVKPRFSISTKSVYENLVLRDESIHPNIDAVLEGIKQSNLNTIIHHMGNILESVTVNKYPMINEIKTTLLTEGAITSLMSGSGPTIFGIFDSKSKAIQAYHNLLLKYENCEVLLTTPYWP